MKLGLSVDWMPNWPSYRMEDCFRAIRGAGFDVIELGINFEYFGWHTPNGIDRLKRMLSDADLLVHSLHSPINELLGRVWDLSAEDDLREMAIDMCKRGIDALNALGGGVLIVHPAGVRIVETEQETRFHRVAESLRNIMDYAVNEDVTVALENLFGTKTQLFWRIFREMGDTTLRYCFDTGHALLEKTEGTPIEKFVRLRDKIVSLHLQDNHGETDEHLMPGEGIFPWADFLPLLHPTYGGPLLLECIPPRGELDVFRWIRIASACAAWL